ncbi:unnamed protein product [Scytosiphon promiscuus]
MGTKGEERSTGKGSPHSGRKPLPSSPWAHASSARKRPRASPCSGSSWSPAQRERQHDASVIDLTSETSHPRDEGSGVHRQGEEGRAAGGAEAALSPRPRPHPPPLPPPSATPKGTKTAATAARARSLGRSFSQLDPGSNGAPRTTPSAAAGAPSSPPRLATTRGAPPPASPPLLQRTAAGQGGEAGQRPPPRSTYVRHFEDAVGTVMRARPDYACLFTPEEREVAHRFERLSEPSKALYVRLFQRKGPWFRADGMLGYDEVDSESDAAGVVCARSGRPAAVFPAPSPFPSRPESPVEPGADDEPADGASCTSEGGRGTGGEIAVTKTEKKRKTSELTVLHGEIQTALRELIEAGFLDALPDDVGRTGPGLEAALAAVACCVKSPEIKALLKRTGGTSKKTTPIKSPAGRHTQSRTGRKRAAAAAAAATAAAGGGRTGMLEELRRRLAGQQTLWGAKSPLVREIERLVSASAEALGVETTAGTIPGGARGKKRRSHWLVAVAGSPRMVFKRALRLMYLTCDTSALSSGRVGAASVRGPAVAGALSSWSPGLSAAFGKTRYAAYVCDPQAKAFQGREDFLRWEAAVELRCALDGAMEETSRERYATRIVPAAAPAGEEGRSTKTEVLVLDSDGELENIEEALVAPDRAEGSPRVKAESGEGRVKDEATAVVQEVQEGEQRVRAAIVGLNGMIAQYLPEGKEHAGPVAVALLCSRCLHAHLGTPAEALSSRLLLPSSSAFRAEAEATEGGLRIDEGEVGEEREDEEAFLLLLKQRCGGVDGPLDAGTRPLGEVGRLGEKKLDGGNRDAGCGVGWCEGRRPKQGERSSPGDKRGAERQLAPTAAGGARSCLCFEAAARGTPMVGGESGGATEEDQKGASRAAVGREDGAVSGNKQVPEFLLQLEAGWVLASAVWEGVALLERARDYERAVELLTQLLATRYTPHRRGRWWDRLSLDLAHTKRLACALWASQEGLNDPLVRGGDRLALEKRAAMLTTRYTPQSMATDCVLRDNPPAAPLLRLLASSQQQPLQRRIMKRHVTARVLVPLSNGKKATSSARKARGRTSRQTPTVGRSAESSSCSERSAPERRAPGCESGEGDGGGSHALPPVGLGTASSNGKATPRAGERFASHEESAGGSSLAGLGQGNLTGGAENRCAAAAAVETTPGAAAAARKADASRAALAQSLRCEGVAELSRVLNDESIAGVVLAATAAAPEETPADEGPGVPEMSITGRRLNREIGVKSRFVGYGDGTACTVESLVLQHLSQREEGGWVGWHCEGSPLRALWALLMWDVVFMDVTDVFQTPFQDAPLDLDFCPLFYLNRRAAVDTRLAEVRAASTTELVALVGDAWLANVNTVCRGLNWDRASVRHLQAIAAGLGGRAVAAVLAALCLNHKHFGGGLPDLLLMRAVRTHEEPLVTRDDGGGAPREVAATALASASANSESEFSTPESFVSWLGVESGVAFDVDGRQDEGGLPPLIRGGGRGRGGGGGGGTGVDAPPPFKAGDMEGLRLETWLLEVKGPSDRLSDRQTAWLRILDRGQAHVGVCHVAEGAGGSHAAAAAEAVAITVESGTTLKRS